MRKLKRGGGWQAVFYTLGKARQVGGIWKLWKAMRTRNACKTCALGMGGQRGGMVNEAGHFPEVCKKSLQAMAADMQGGIRDEFFSTYSVAQLESFSPRELESCGRLTSPLLRSRGEGYYRPIAWDDALSRIQHKLQAVAPEETFWYFSGRSSNEAGFLLQLFARLYGTNNVNNCSYYCHQASGVGLNAAIGTGTATVTLDDVEHADLVLVIGGNPASNHPRLMRSLLNVRRRGGNVMVINPVVETGMVNFAVPSDVRSLFFGSPIASLYIQPDIGGDLALLTGIAKRLDEMGAIDEEFLAEACDGWPELSLSLRSTSWSEIHRKSGVGQEQIDAAAEMLAKSQSTVFSWTMGITHHLHGVQNVQAIANLALMRGMVGRPQAGLLPIRGHSNVQGMGSMGVTPKLKDAIFERLQQHFDVRLPERPGMDTMASMEAAHAGRAKVGICLGGNLYGSNPDATFAREALRNLEMIVYLSTTLNTGHAHGLADETLILPVLARDEEPQPTTQESMFNYVRLSDGGPARHSGPRSEVRVVSQLADRLLGSDGPVNWKLMADTGRIRETIAKIIPGFEQMASIERTREEFQIPGRTFHAPKFNTPSGRARLRTHELPDLAGDDNQLRLMTVRSEGQFNTVVYEEHDLYRGQDRRDVILLHPDDVKRLRLAADERVTVRSEAGQLANILVRPFDEIKPGNALMYYPEANMLVPRRLDPASHTPAFKSVAVSIESSAQVPALV
jgi:molybdopterin-dependent oxidoreductase alpha subunit